MSGILILVFIGALALGALAMASKGISGGGKL